VYVVDRAQPGGAGREHDGAHVPAPALRLHGVEVNAAVWAGGDGPRGNPEDLTHAPVGVVGALGVDDGAVRSQLAGDPQRLEVSDGAAGC